MPSLEQLRQTLGGSTSVETAEAAEAVGTLKPLVPPDLERCQAMKPGNGPFTMGGRIGNPRNGYRVRCEARATVIGKQLVPGSDGRCGSMSLCDDCAKVMTQDIYLKVLGPIEFKPINCG